MRPLLPSLILDRSIIMQPRAVPKATGSLTKRKLKKESQLLYVACYRVSRLPHDATPVLWQRNPVHLQVIIVT